MCLVGLHYNIQHTTANEFLRSGRSRLLFYILTMSEGVVNVHFDENRRRQGLTCEAQAMEDKSRKGSVDEKIVNLVQAINESSDFFTTSSCSGRAILFTHEINASLNTGMAESDSKAAAGAGEGECSAAIGLRPTDTPGKTRKKGCRWLYVTHDEINLDALLEAWSGLENEIIVSFKIEPSIFHIQCRSLDGAKKLVHLATESGFRNSGMVVGKDNKITVAIRSAIGMEVPLQKAEPAIISNSFFKLLELTGNEKLRESWSRTDKLFAQLATFLQK